MKRGESAESLDTQGLAAGARVMCNLDIADALVRYGVETTLNQPFFGSLLALYSHAAICPRRMWTSLLMSFV